MLHGYSEPFRLGRNQFCGSLLVFLRENMTCSILNIKQLTIEALLIELNLRKRKWLLCCSYNPHKNLIVAHLRETHIALDVLSSKYENIIIIGDLIWSQKNLDFCQSFNMESLINNFTCYKNPNKSTCIDLVLTNKPRFFKNSSVLETRLFYFHHGVTPCF